MVQKIDIKSNLQEIEILIEKKNFNPATVLCRVTLEAMLKIIGKEKLTQYNFNNNKEFKGIWDIAKKIFDHKIITDKWFKVITALTSFSGNDAIHSNREINIDEIIFFYNRIKEFFYEYIEKNGKKISTYFCEDPIIKNYFEIIILQKKNSILSLSTGNEVYYTQIDIIISDKHNPSLKKRKNLVKWLIENNYCVFLFGKPGSGKTSTMKYVTSSMIKRFIDKNIELVPLLASLGRYHQYENGFLWLCGNNEEGNQLIRRVKQLSQEGKLIIFADGWDEIRLDKKAEIIHFFRNLLENGNKITITSRIIPEKDIPDFRYKIDGDNKKIRLSKGNIGELTQEQQENFLSSRSKEWTKERLKKFIEVFQKSKLEAIPLWLDLLATIPKIIENKDLDEIKLLGYWINQIQYRENGKIVFESLQIIEFLAYEVLRDIKPVYITKHYLLNSINISYLLFNALLKIGWLIPTGFHNSEQLYDFVHLRLTEYLASRYISKEWFQIEDKLFDRYYGILSRPNKQEIIKLAVLEAQRQNFANDKLMSMVYTIAGEEDWDIGDKIRSYKIEKLRDPFLAIILVRRLNLSPFPISWDELINEFLIEVIEKFYFNEKMRNWTRFLNREKFILSLIAGVPQKLLFSKLSEIKNRLIYDLYRLDLSIPIIDNALDLFNINIIKDEFSANLFFTLLDIRKNKDRWLPIVVQYLEENIHKKNILSARGLLHIKDTNTIERLFTHWCLNDDEEIAKRGIELIYYIRDRVKLLQKLVPKILLHDKDEIREFCAIEIIKYPKLLNREILNQCFVDLDEKSQFKSLNSLIHNDETIVTKFADIFLKYSSKKQVSYLLTSLIDTSVLQQDKFYILDWFIATDPKMTIHYLVSTYYNEPILNEFLNAISPLIETTSFTSDEEKNLIDYFSPKPKDSLRFAKKHFSSSKDDLKLFELKYNYIQLVISDKEVNLEVLNEYLEKNSSFFMEIIEYLKLYLNSQEDRNTYREKLLELEKPHKRLFDYFDNYPEDINFDLIHFILNLDDEILYKIIMHQILDKKSNFRNNPDFLQILELMMKTKVTDNNKQMITYIASVINQKTINKSTILLDLMIEHPLVTVRAMVFRLLAESCEIDIVRVSKRISACMTNKTGRPLYEQVDPLSAKKTHGIIFRNELEPSKKEYVNFGLINGLHLMGKMKFESLDFNTLIIASRTHILNVIDTWDEFESPEFEQKIIDYKLWKNNKKTKTTKTYEFGQKSKEKMLLQGLYDSNEQIILTTLFYLEDIFYFDNNLYKEKQISFQTKINKKLEELTKNCNLLIATISQFILLSALNEENKIEQIKKLTFTKENLQAILWSTAFSSPEKLDTYLKDNLEKVDIKEILENLKYFIPLILAFPKSYRYIWETILSSNEEEFSEIFFLKEKPEIPKFEFYFFWHTFCLINKVNQGFITTKKEGIIYSIVDLLYRTIPNNISLPLTESKNIIKSLKDLNSEKISISIELFNISMGLNKVNVSKLLISSKLNIIEYAKFKSIFNLLSFDEKVAFLKKVIKDCPKEILFTIFLLKRLPTRIQVLDLLLLTYETYEKELRVNFSINRQEIDSITANVLSKLFENDFDIIVKNYTRLIAQIPLYYLSRETLEKINQFYRNKQTKEANNIFNYTFQLLYPKIWYSNREFWKYALKS